MNQEDYNRALNGDKNLQGADLSYANLWKANLTNANLIGANLIRVDLEGVKGL